MHQESLYIVKPEAFKHREVIRQLVEENGLGILWSRMQLLSEAEIERLYPDVTGELLTISKQLLTNGRSEVTAVGGEDAIQTLLQLGGKSTDPRKCASTSIRYLFGQHEPVAFGKAVYYLNGFHRSATPEEARRDLNLFGKVGP